MQILLSQHIWILIKMQFECVPKDLIWNNPALIRRRGIIWINDGLVCWGISVSLVINELKALWKHWLLNAVNTNDLYC